MQDVTRNLGQVRWWSPSRLSRLALFLAFCIPVLTVALGTAIRTDVEHLGAAMIAFWGFALASFGLAIQAAQKVRGREHRIWVVIVAIVLAAVPVLKEATMGLHRAEAVVPLETAKQRAQTNEGQGCRPELVSSDNNPVSRSKNDRSGNFAWLVGIGNYYEWHLEVLIQASDSETNGAAAAVGEMSPWYSFLIHKRAARAKARGNVDCRADKNGCACFAQSTSQTNPDGDFTAKVAVIRNTTPAGVDLDVSTSAAIAGSPGGEVTLGTESAGIKLPAQNTALDSIRRRRFWLRVDGHLALGIFGWDLAQLHAKPGGHLYGRF
jgi:hypothetical protein